MERNFFLKYESIFNRVCVFLGEGWKIDRRIQDDYRIHLIHPDYRNYSISARLENNKIKLLGCVHLTRRGNQFSSCSVSPLRDAIGIARDIKRKILCNAREQISFYEADTKGERLLREEREYTINLLSRLVDAKRYEGYYGGLCQIKTNHGITGKVDDTKGVIYRLELDDLNKDQLIKLIGFISTLER
ncbi:hypothetical protein CV935_22690 [Salmonella enterica subsp. enterica serovar Litchfield]|nr:hypothetical protein [Salmonella enterica subsp. enterica serovar Litchfield]EFE0694073.1 hypothetical protein [Escherichia coli]EGB9568385.1 hypothetical protein [Salmonella enterica]EIH3568154.1 hypothetical protein [Escherichia coli]